MAKVKQVCRALPMGRQRQDCYSFHTTIRLCGLHADDLRCELLSAVVQ